MSFGAERPSNASDRGPEARLTSDERVEVIRAGLEQWREGFLAYLLLPKVDLADRHIADGFVDSYAGWYPDQMSFMKAQVDSLGWADALDTFKEEWGIPDRALDLDWDIVWEHCLEIYDVVERLGGVHVFLC